MLYTYKQIREITIVFVVLDSQNWLVYIDEMPAINSQGKTPNEALKRVLGELNAYDTVHHQGQPMPSNKFKFRVSRVETNL